MFGCGCCGGSRDEQRRQTTPNPPQVVMIPCQYCKTLFPQTATFCPNCGARRTA